MLGVRERNPVLRTLRSRDRGHDRSKVELEVLRVVGLRLASCEESLRLGVRLDQRDMLLAASGEPQVPNVSASIGKTAIVEPYSGAMLPIVARFASGTAATPGP